jgi:uncharacterized protein
MPTKSTEAIPIQEGIQGVVDQIVAQFRPRKVILFGSYAEGTRSDDSDVDLLVLMDTEDDPLRVAARISAAVDHPCPLDIVVFTPDTFADSAKRGRTGADPVRMG